MSGDLNAKLHFAISILIFGSMFEKFGLKVKISSIDKGVLNLRTSNNSRKVW